MPRPPMELTSLTEEQTRSALRSLILDEFKVGGPSSEVVLLDFGRSAGLFDNGKLIAKWPVQRVEAGNAPDQKG
jgi:hypothetical protein